MDIARLQQLLALALSQREAVEVTERGHRIGIEVIDAVAAAALRSPDKATSVDAPHPDAIRAPCFGLVHLAPAPGAPPFVRVGDAIAAGQLVCLVEAMKVFNGVAAERAGRVAEILVVSGVEVERGQPLFRLETADGVA